MAITRGGTASAYWTGTTTAAIPLTAPAVGDWMILVQVGDNSSHPYTLPIGWTLLYGGVMGTRYIQILGRIKVSGDTVANILSSVSSSRTTLFLYGSGADPVADWQLGSEKHRNASPTETVTSTAPAVTTLEANTLAIAIFAEATSAAEGSAPVLTGSGWTSWVRIPDIGTNIEQVSAAYKAMPTAGTTNQVLETYPNVQANNGSGMQIVLTPAVTNIAPVAAFTHTEVALATTVNGSTSSDSDGTISSYDWDWGDGTSHGSGATPSAHTYTFSGTYTVTLLVTDNGGLQNSVSHSVTVLATGDQVALGSLLTKDIRLGSVKPNHLALGTTAVRRMSSSLDSIKNDNPYEIAHRGFSADNPEHSVEAYADAFAYGMRALEVSIQYSSNGTPWICHDATVDRTTNGTGTISALTDTYLAGLIIDTIPGVSGTMMKLDDYLALYGEKVVTYLEDKTYTHKADVLARLALIPAANKRFVWKRAGDAAPPSDVVALGFKTWGYWFDADMATSWPTYQASYDYVGVDYHSSDATLSAAITTAGAARSVAHILPDATQRTRMIGLGFKGLMCAAHSAATRKEPRH